MSREEYRVQTLAPRQDLTGADRTWAARYERDNVLLYSRSSKKTGIEKGEYARVRHGDPSKKLLTLVQADGTEKTYDPHRQQGVSVYRHQKRAFSVGHRVQFTAPANDLKITNRELGTIQSITDDGHIGFKMDGGSSVSFDPRQHPHLDHGYAVTSHSSQGHTADRVLIHIHTSLAAKDLLNNRMAYVAVSRGARDAQIFTSDRENLPQALSKAVSQQSAHTPELAPEEAVVEREIAAKPQEKVYTAAEQERHHAPIREALEPEDAAQFKWKGETGTVQTYQNTQTSRNIHIDAKGQFYSQGGKPTSHEAALDLLCPKDGNTRKLSISTV